MTPRRWRRLGMGVCLLGALAAAVIVARARTAVLAEPTTGDCEVLLGGVPTASATSPENAIEVSAAGSLVASGHDPRGTAAAELRATLAQGLPDRATWSMRRRSFEPPRPDFEVAIRMSDVTGYGVGLTLVTVVTDNCSSSAWVDVGDRPPVFTAIGLAGLALTSAGAVSIIVNLWRSVARGAATFPGALGAGLPYGAGIAVIAQQSGASPLTPATLLAWIVIGSGSAAFLHLARRSISIWRRDRSHGPGP